MCLSSNSKLFISIPQLSLFVLFYHFNHKNKLDEREAYWICLARAATANKKQLDLAKSKELANALLKDFFQIFPDEESCIDYFRQIREDVGITCPKCGYTEHKWLDGAA